MPIGIDWPNLIRWQAVQPPWFLTQRWTDKLVYLGWDSLRDLAFVNHGLERELREPHRLDHSLHFGIVHPNPHSHHPSLPIAFLRSRVSTYKLSDVFIPPDSLSLYKSKYQKEGAHLSPW